MSEDAAIRRSVGPWLWLTAPIALLLAVAAGSGLLVDGIYLDAPAFAAQAMGQDFLSLVVVLPALVVSALLARRGSARARLVWLGLLVYIVYTYAIAAFDVRFNGLFLVYTALLGCSLYALIGGVATTDMGALRARFGDSTPVRTTSISLAVVAVLFYMLWLSDVVPALIARTVPASVAAVGLPTSPVHVLDMAWILPAMLMAAYWLWHRCAIGYVLSGALLAFVSTMCLAIASMTVFMRRAGIAAPAEQTVAFIVVAALTLGLLAWYLRAMKRP